jgi:hypothetical protein
MPKAVMTHRPHQEAAEPDVLAGADYEELCVLRQKHEELARIPMDKFQDPIRTRGHRLEHCCDRIPVAVVDLVPR